MVSYILTPARSLVLRSLCILTSIFFGIQICFCDVTWYRYYKHENTRLTAVYDQTRTCTDIVCCTKCHSDSSCSNVSYSPGTEECQLSTINFTETYSATEDNGEWATFIRMAFLTASKVQEVTSPKPIVIDDESQEKQKDQPIFIFTGMSQAEKDGYGALVEQLGGTVLDSQEFDSRCTHRVISTITRNEKFLASIATGNWVLHKSYFDACRKEKCFVDEDIYEWGSEYTMDLVKNLDTNVRQLASVARAWRIQLSEAKKQSGVKVGAFSEWKVHVLLCCEAKREQNFKRLLEAGGASVAIVRPPFNITTDVTHAFVDLQKEKDGYGALVEQLGGTVLDSQEFDSRCTHLVISTITRNEKFLASIATGNWVLHKSYFDACRKEKCFVDKDIYEWGSEYTMDLVKNLDTNVRQLASVARAWRIQLSEAKKQSGVKVGAFSEWKVLLCCEAKREQNFKRLLEAGGASVAIVRPPFNITTDVTHAFVDLQKSDIEELLKCGCHCLRQEYILTFLTDPRTTTEKYCFPEIKMAKAALEENQSSNKNLKRKASTSELSLKRSKKR